MPPEVLSRSLGQATLVVSVLLIKRFKLLKCFINPSHRHGSLWLSNIGIIYGLGVYFDEPYNAATAYSCARQWLLAGVASGMETKALF